MPDEPSYLGLLNAVAVGEARGGALLSAWADVTANEALAGLLRMVAIREREHAAAFTKRLSELGFAVRETAEDRFRQDLAFVSSPGAGDADKFERLFGFGDGDGSARDDPLAGIFRDKTIDAATGALLGRYIAEERDSECRLAACYQGLRPETAQDDLDLSDVCRRLDRLTETLNELKALKST